MLLYVMACDAHAISVKFGEYTLVWWSPRFGHMHTKIILVCIMLYCFRSLYIMMYYFVIFHTTSYYLITVYIDFFNFRLLLVRACNTYAILGSILVKLACQLKISDRISKNDKIMGFENWVEIHWSTWEANHTIILYNCSHTTNNDKYDSQRLTILSNLEKKSIDPFEKPAASLYHITAAKIQIVTYAILKN